MTYSLLQKLKNAVPFSLDLLFKPAESRGAKWAAVILLGVLFAAGVLHWGIFLNWFNNQFDILDWHQQVGPYLEFLTKALRSGQFPLHAQSSFMIPDRYLSRQNRPFSPQILLLDFLDPAAYVLVNVWIFYALGFVGLLLIRRRYHLSFVSFLALFLLFNLNGHILAHFAVGHFEWVAYFLLPFYVLLVLKMLEGEETGWKWQLSMVLVMLALTLQGLVHYFIYCMAFLLLLGVFQPRFLSPVIRAILFSGLVSMIRLLPPALQYAGGTRLQDLGGFTSVFDLLQSFVVLQNPRGDWEREYYVGAIGFAYLVYFGVIRNWVKEQRYRPLYIPMLVMTFFAIGSIYHPLFISHIPFMDSQRAPTRFIIIPLVFLIFLATIQFQAFLNAWDPKTWETKVLLLVGEALMAYDLIYNTRIWNIDNYSLSKRVPAVVNVAVGNYSDPPYLATLIVGSACSLITLVVLGILAYRERGKRPV